jgi:oleate hydratase
MNMYYSAGTYEAFAHPEKPKDVDKKSAYIIGTGLAGLSAAFYLVRDGQMAGERIHLLEKLELAGGSCDGRKDVTKGFYMRGGREMDNHFECMWDMFRDVESIETPGVSVLDEYYWLNKHDPNYSLCRASINRGEDAHTDRKFELDRESAMALSKLFMTSEKELEDKKISEVLPDSFWNTNFWLYWQTMFAFQKWSSALEMKRYLCRYVHHIDGLPDFSALRFTKYNQFESMILPLVKYLNEHGVKIEYGIDVKNVMIDNLGTKKIAKQIIYEKDGNRETIELTEDDLVFITNGCCTDTSCYGDQDNAPDLSKIKNGYGESWDMWKAIAAQARDGEFGNPEKFCSDIDATNWMSATVATSNEEIIQHIIKVCKRDPRNGKVTTGGIVTVKDSTENWYLSWTINRQPQFKSQDKNTVLVWLYSLNTNRKGNFVKKAMRECTGAEVAMEWLYHIGIPEDEIEDLAHNACNTTTCFMPYINAFFQPRKNTDRPHVVPDGSVNFAFIGQFAETPRDTIFTTEYSIRTGMEAVYTLLDVDRAVPEVWGSQYDVRELLKAVYYAIDKKPITEFPLTFVEKEAVKLLVKKVKGTDIEQLLKDSKLIE